MAQVEAATGIEFVELPAYNLAPNGRLAPRPSGVDLAITFDALAPTIGGLGGPTEVRGQFESAAGIEISSAISWTVPEATNALLHELGHAAGLAHPVGEPPAYDPANAVMDPVGAEFPGYQPGDLCGFFEIVWRSPCAGASGVTLGQGVIAQ